jgi:short-subunit dehydrogenase
MKSVLIVGGNSDIGFGVAKAFAKNRFNVHLASRNVNQMKIKKFYIDNNFDVNCKVSFLDINNKKIINNFFNKKLTCPDVLVISSGFMEKQEKNICDLINVNFSSPVKFIEFFLILSSFFGGDCTLREFVRHCKVFHFLDYFEAIIMVVGVTVTIH